jgi:hypothetical protein
MTIQEMEGLYKECIKEIGKLTDALIKHGDTLAKHIDCTLVIAEKQHDNTGMIYKDKKILRDNIKNIEKLKEMQ